MTPSNDWSPDEQLDTEAFEQGDEAADEGERLDPELLEAIEGDPSLDPRLQVDERELEEIGAALDDPEEIVTLDGGMDDPDGLGRPSHVHSRRDDDDEGWDLAAPIVRGDEPESDSIDETPAT